MIKRLLQNGVAIALGQGVNILYQLLLPPAFLHYGGVEKYGAWLILAAGAAYVATLDFGLQTCVVNRLGMLFHTGDQAGFRRLQSVGLRLTLGVAGVAALGALLILLLPFESWLRLSLAPGEARLTLLLLTLTVLLQIVFGQVVGVFRATGRAHSAQHWTSAQRLGSLTVQLWLITQGASLAALAAAPLAVSGLTLGGVLAHLRWRAPECFPTMREWDGAEARALLKPSFFFGLGLCNNFLLFEAPLLVLQHVAGAAAVVTFATTRTLFSAGRQLLTPLQYSLLPEITRLHAQHGHATLQKLHRLAEVVGLVGGASLNAMLALASGVILQFWLGGKVTPTASFIALMAAVSVAATCRDSKFIFQVATNRHERTMTFILACHVGVTLASLVLGVYFQEIGVALAWLISELAINQFLIVENRRLLGAEIRPPFVLHLTLLLGFTGSIWSARIVLASATTLFQLLAVAAAGVILAGVGLGTIGREPAREFLRRTGRLSLGTTARAG